MQLSDKVAKLNQEAKQLTAKVEEKHKILKQQLEFLGIKKTISS